MVSRVSSASLKLNVEDLQVFALPNVHSFFVPEVVSERLPSKNE